MKELLGYAKLVHALLAVTVVALFYYQAGLGLYIRFNRKKQRLTPKAVRWHRKNGPWFIIFFFLVYLGGLAIVGLGHNLDLLKHPFHLANGTAVGGLLILTYFVQKNIYGREDSTWRTGHMMIGITILALFLFQAFLGAGILL